MATTNAHSSVTVKVNDGGTVVNGGNVGSDNPMTVSKSLATMADGGTDYGSKVLAQDGTSVENEDYAGVTTALSAGGTLAFQPSAAAGERNFLLRGAGTEDGNNKINNSASSILTVPGSEYASAGIRQVNTVHAVNSTRQLGEDDATFNILARPSTAMVPGRTKGTDNGVASNFIDPAVAGGATDSNDSEGSATRAIPGELTYHFGGLAAPTTDEYKARDSYEA
jgi:hypothetical protein